MAAPVRTAVTVAAVVSAVCVLAAAVVSPVEARDWWRVDTNTNTDTDMRTNRASSAWVAAVDADAGANEARPFPRDVALGLNGDGAAAREPLSRGTWSVEPMTFVLTDVSRGARADLYSVGIGGGYYFAERHALRVEVYGTHVDQTGDNALGVGANLHGRWHFLQRGRFSLYFEGGGGLLQTTVSLPDGPRERGRDGTHFNFTATAILGASYQLRDRLHLNTAFRYMHISNARRRGADRNPSTEAVGGSVGLMWTF